MTRCQSCLERGEAEPNEAVGIYQGSPICDVCLGPILDNLNRTQIDDLGDPNSLPERKKKALELLDKFEELFEDWPLKEHEVLISRDDFFNHRPPAVVNLTVDQIKDLNTRRKGVLFAFRIKDERWATIIDEIKIAERRKAGLENVAKSLVEKTKTRNTGGKDAAQKQKEKLAKMMGISVAELDRKGAGARQEELTSIVGTKVVDTIKHEASTSEVLASLQQQVKAQTEPVKTAVVKGRCQKCGKFTCMCLK